MATFKRLLSFLSPYRRGVAISLLAGMGAMATSVAIPWLIGAGVNTIQAHSRTELLPIALAILAAGLVRLALSIVRRLSSGRVSLGVEYDLRNRIYRHLQSLELAFFDQEQSGQLMSRATIDLQAIRFFLGYGLIFMVQSFFTIVLAAAVMVALNPGLALLALAPTPFMVVAAQRYGRSSRPALQEVQQRIGELTATAEESISGMRVIKGFARESEQMGRFEAKVSRVFDQSMVAARLRSLYNPMLAFLPNLGLAVVLIVGGRMAIKGSISLGEFVQFYTYMLMLVVPMRGLGMTLGGAQRAVAAGNRLFEILDRRPKIRSKPGAAKLAPGPGRVEMKGVCFSYDSGKRALDSIDLTIGAGRTVALAGPTGSGKTTLVMLIPRLYQVSSGTIAIDGQEIDELEVESLRSEIAIVSDDTFLFSATVADNIAYANPGASFDEIAAAARGAQATEFIEELPDGFDTVIGERGYTLSGGQRQRIAIARALLADPRVLILDDATSSVDAATEAKIKLALRQLIKGRTTFVIAHRLSTLSLADEIILLEDGRIAGRGSHEELLKREGIYSEIARLEGLGSTIIDLPEREVSGL